MKEKKAKKTTNKGNKKKGLVLILLSLLMLFSSTLFPFIVNPFYFVQIFTTILFLGNGLNIVFWIFVIFFSSWFFLDINLDFFSKQRFVAIFLILICISLFVTTSLLFASSDTKNATYLSLKTIYRIMLIDPSRTVIKNFPYDYSTPLLINGGILLPLVIWIFGGVIFIPLTLLIILILFLYFVYVIVVNDYEIFLQKLNPISKNDGEIETNKQGETIDLNQPTKEFQLKLTREEQQKKDIIEKIRINSNKNNYNDLSKKILKEKENINDLREKVLKRIDNTNKKNRMNSTISEERREEILRSLGVEKQTFTKKKDYSKHKDTKYTFIKEEKDEPIIKEKKDKITVEKNIQPFKKEKEEQSFSNEYTISITNEMLINYSEKEINKEIDSIKDYYEEIFSDDKFEESIEKIIVNNDIDENKKVERKVIIEEINNEITVEDYLDIPKEIEAIITKEIEVTEPIEVKKTILKAREKKIITKKEITDEQEIERPKNWCSPFTLPSTSILSQTKINFDSAKLVSEVTEKSKRLSDVLTSFGIKASVHSFEIGPTVSTFKIQLEAGIKTSKVTNLEDNMKLTLGAEYIRIIAPIPGTSFIGIEVPNSIKKPVRFKDVFDETKEEKSNEGIQISIGQDVSGKPLSFDLTKAPHLLVAGSTGSGKSVAINTILASILLRYKPTDVQLVLVDPKMVEFTPFHGIPHLTIKVITDPVNANNALKAMVEEMEERYKEMAKMGVKKIEELNEKLIKNGEQKRPYIVIIIDELADLMMTSAKEVEDSIMRITQKARAAGIHMVLATQRPSTEIITGTIKSNIPSRMAFTVASSIDSRTILGQIGAEKLIGMGDMLVSLYGKLPVRGQGAYISNEEIEDITKFTKSQCSPFYTIDLEKTKNDISTLGNNLVSIDDPMYLASIEIVIRQNKASTSMLQRHLNIGYNRAAIIIDTLESEGIIGPSRGSKPREVLVEE